MGGGSCDAPRDPADYCSVQNDHKKIHLQYSEHVLKSIHKFTKQSEMLSSFRDSFFLNCNDKKASIFINL